MSDKKRMENNENLGSNYRLSGYDDSWDEYAREELVKEGISRKFVSDEVRASRRIDFSKKNQEVEKADTIDVKKSVQDFLSSIGTTQVKEQESEITDINDVELSDEEIEEMFPWPPKDLGDLVEHHEIYHKARRYKIANANDVDFDVLKKAVLDIENSNKPSDFFNTPGFKLMATEEGLQYIPVDYKLPKEYENASEFKSDDELNSSYDEYHKDLE